MKDKIEKHKAMVEFLHKNEEDLHPKDKAALEMIKTLQLKRTFEAKQKARVNREVKIGRNEPCPCGSGKKFKRCCIE